MNMSTNIKAKTQTKTKTKVATIAIALVSMLALPTVTQAREVKLTTQLTSYDGDGAYVAIYLTDANGRYQSTLWMAGKKAKYYKHLKDWARGSGKHESEYDGKTGASITNANTLTIQPMSTH